MNDDVAPGPVTLGDWAAAPVRSSELVDPAPVRALAALLDSGLPAPEPGDPLPALWHWCALPRWTPTSATGPDGHPPRGSFLPPVDLPRRMFAGGEVAVVSPLVVGETVDRVDEVTSVEQKSGRSGPLVVVAVTTQLRAADGSLRLRERQDLVFRGAAAPTYAADTTSPPAASAPPGRPLDRLADGAGWRVRTDPTLLMRWSAASANVHRIHYDWPYATRVEGYPGLVVQGPLMTVLLAETLRLEGHLIGAATLRHRNRSPLFCHDPARIGHLRVDDAVVATLARDAEARDAEARDAEAGDATTCTTLAITPTASEDPRASPASPTSPASPLSKETPHA